MISMVSIAQQNCYWVFFTDKNDTQFDPYSYFDAKAIERYEKSGADLYDISNYPLNSEYAATVGSYSSEVIGQSRWLNAMGIEATAENALIISNLPFVSHIQQISSDFILAETEQTTNNNHDEYKYVSDVLTDQVVRLGGQHFVDHGIDGKGMRICILDGGFPSVDTHPAFKHLRDNNQIIATYNFPSDREDVYGWNAHGTMVLSCIAGINDEGKKLGLATGAEFLLARTEILPEPFKEEIWWAMGAEWADKNGADIINSSLGYGKDRYWTKDMDGTSYVAKAANMAVEKGILICNAAGNEGDDKRWMTIITPSDAENVLCVGGIAHSLDYYQHISFSSYGPSADKRLKPNVVAFGHAQVADPGDRDGGFTYVDGTSFSSPLTAGFAACAWQTRRELTALQLKSEIEKSADLYPYFDYAFGYGVPQAAYFTNETKEAERSFNIVQEKDGVRITFPAIVRREPVFISLEGADGVLVKYYQTNPNPKGIELKNKDMGDAVKLNVSYNGFYDCCVVTGNGESLDGTFKEVKKEGWKPTTFFRFNYVFADGKWDGFNRHISIGRSHLYGKGYKAGYALSVDFNRFVAGKTTIREMQLRAELMQRVVIQRIGLNWDLGVYGGINITRRARVIDGDTRTTYYNRTALNLWEYGLRTSISYSIMGMIDIGVYGGYRLSDILTNDDDIIGLKNEQPSPWGAGIEIAFSL